MRRKLVTAFELLVISFFLIGGVMLWLKRKETKTLVYPASRVVQSPLPLPDTTQKELK